MTRFLMLRFLMLLAVAALAASTTGCGCCGSCFRPAPPAVCAAPVPACPPVCADPCSVPTTTTYGYAPPSFSPGM
jgi:hypothetical protein